MCSQSPKGEPHFRRPTCSQSEAGPNRKMLIGVNDNSVHTRVYHLVPGFRPIRAYKRGCSVYVGLDGSSGRQQQ
jgi:hypothetical protein